MNWRVEIIDILIIVAVFMLVEFARTQTEPVTDWGVWLRAVGMGALYKAVPPLLGLLGAMRARFAKAGDSV